MATVKKILSLLFTIVSAAVLFALFLILIIPLFIIGIFTGHAIFRGNNSYFSYVNPRRGQAQGDTAASSARNEEDIIDVEVIDAETGGAHDSAREIVSAPEK